MSKPQLQTGLFIHTALQVPVSLISLSVVAAEQSCFATPYHPQGKKYMFPVNPQSRMARQSYHTGTEAMGCAR